MPFLANDSEWGRGDKRFDYRLLIIGDDGVFVAFAVIISFIHSRFALINSERVVSFDMQPNERFACLVSKKANKQNFHFQ